MYGVRYWSHPSQMVVVPASRFMKYGLVKVDGERAWICAKTHKLV